MSYVSFFDSHAELDLGDLKSTRFTLTNLKGEKIDKDMTSIITGLREGEYYRSQNAPKDQWTFIGSKNLSLIHRFKNE